jgi:hypothetical protein
MKKPQRSASRAKSPSKKQEHHSARYARGWETRRRNAKKAAKAKAEALNVLTTPPKSMQTPPAAQHDGDRIPDKHEQLVNLLIPLARKKDHSLMVAMLRDHVRSERSQEAETAERGARELAAQLRQRENDRIVCGFMSEVAIAMRQNRGKLPDGLVFNVPAVTVQKIASALHKAGYSPSGISRDGERERIADDAADRKMTTTNRFTVGADDRFAI